MGLRNASTGYSYKLRKIFNTAEVYDACARSNSLFGVYNIMMLKRSNTYSAIVSQVRKEEGVGG